MKSKLDFYISFYERLALQGFQAYVDHSKEQLALICVDGYNIAYLTKADSIEPNPYAEGVEAGTIDRIRGILAETAVKFINEQPFFTEKELTAIHTNLSNFVMMPDNGLDFESGQVVDNIIGKIEGIVPELVGHELSSGLENEADMSEGVEP